MDVFNKLKSAVSNVLPGNPLSRDFEIYNQVASAGPGLLWKVYSAVKRTTKEEASVFLFEKKAVERYSRRDRDVIFNLLRGGVQQLTKLRHPKILAVIQPLEESREALAFATEPVFASLANILGDLSNVSPVPKELQEFQLYDVEIKHGLLQLRHMRASLLGAVPDELREHVKLLLNTEPTVRPDAAQLSKVPFFEDMGCVTLQYIDSLFQRENIEKSNFFKGLPKVITKLPKIVLIFLQNMNLLLSKTPKNDIQAHVLPMVFRALEADSPQIQELCLSIIPTFAELIDYPTLKNSLVPRIKKLCLGTTVLTVRVNCLLCLGQLMDHMDKWYVLDEILPFLHKIPTREPAVLMSILGIHKVAFEGSKLGITKDALANKVLPFLIPIATDNNLNLAQFNAFMSVIRDMLSKMESEHRTKLEQLDQLKQEQRSLEITRITGQDGELGPGHSRKQHAVCHCNCSNAKEGQFICEKLVMDAC
nr:hypothetical protein BaRGS_003379 [Batillaria attramentaria]